VRQLSVDYVERALTLDLWVWVGDIDDPPEKREAYRQGQLRLSDLQFLVVEPPDPRYPFRDSVRLVVDGCDMSKNLDNELLGSFSDEAFVRSLWVNQWNSFIHVAAKKAEIIWQGEGILCRPQHQHIRPGKNIDLT